MRLAIDGGGYASATSAFSTANEVAALHHVTLVGKLSGYAAMAGDSSVAGDFAASYDDGAREAVNALSDLVEAFANLGRLTSASLVNHASADVASVVGGSRVHAEPPDSTSYVSVLPATPPSSLGGDLSSFPTELSWILDQVEGFVWPDADTDRLRAAAQTWRGAGENIDQLTTYCDSAVRGFWGERSPEIPVAVAATTDLADTARETAAQYVALAVACETYADEVEQQRAAILDLVHDLLRDAVIIQGIGLVLGAVSGGITAAGAAAINAAKIAAAAPRFLAITTTLRTLAGAVAATIRAASGALKSTRTRLTKFRNARTTRGATATAPTTTSSSRAPGWLKSHEHSRSHTLRDHVGKTDDELLTRLKSDPGLPATSTFPDVASAESAVSRAMTHHDDAIRSWLLSSNSKMRLDDRLDEVTGYSMDRSGTMSAVSGVRVILVRDPTMPNGYRILTSFPQP